MAFFGEIAIEPIPAWASFIDKDEMRTFVLQLTEEVIDITLAGTNVAKGDDLGVVVLGDIGNGNGLFVDIQTDVECARLVHG